MSGGRIHDLLLSLRVNHQEKNFLVLEMSLLHCFVVTKEIAAGGGTSSILYKLFPNVIVTVLGQESYTTCHFHKYG